MVTYLNQVQVLNMTSGGRLTSEILDSWIVEKTLYLRFLYFLWHTRFYSLFGRNIPKIKRLDPIYLLFDRIQSTSIVDFSGQRPSGVLLKIQIISLVKLFLAANRFRREKKEEEKILLEVKMLC